MRCSSLLECPDLWAAVVPSSSWRNGTVSNYRSFLRHMTILKQLEKHMTVMSLLQTGTEIQRTPTTHFERTFVIICSRFATSTNCGSLQRVWTGGATCMRC